MGERARWSLFFIIIPPQTDRSRNVVWAGKLLPSRIDSPQQLRSVMGRILIGDAACARRRHRWFSRAASYSFHDAPDSPLRGKGGARSGQAASVCSTKSRTANVTPKPKPKPMCDPKFKMA